MERSEYVYGIKLIEWMNKVEEKKKKRETRNSLSEKSIKMYATRNLCNIIKKFSSFSLSLSFQLKSQSFSFFSIAFLFTFCFIIIIILILFLRRLLLTLFFFNWNELQRALVVFALHYMLNNFIIFNAMHM